MCQRQVSTKTVITVSSLSSFPNVEKSKERAIGPRETTVVFRVKGLLSSKGRRGKSGDKERRRQRCAISSDRAAQDMAAISREWPDLSFCEIFSPLRLCTWTTTPCIVNSKCIHSVSSTQALLPELYILHSRKTYQYSVLREIDWFINKIYLRVLTKLLHFNWSKHGI